jgi:hypothetical protein
VGDGRREGLTVYWLGIYIGIAIIVSLRLPANVNMHDEYIEEVTPSLRVGVGLLWPLYYVLKYINRRK